jgi:hypothetical protein
LSDNPMLASENDGWKLSSEACTRRSSMGATQLKRENKLRRLQCKTRTAILCTIEESKNRRSALHPSHLNWLSRPNWLDRLNWQPRDAVCSESDLYCITLGNNCSMQLRNRLHQKKTADNGLQSQNACSPRPKRIKSNIQRVLAAFSCIQRAGSENPPVNCSPL